ncbi:hypothetical protein [Mycobacterium marinum]|uniref:hypothetical protein n=1 Tax=Mycobacterium marinum TaxID=1781 RepID=UPI0035644F75
MNVGQPHVVRANDHSQVKVSGSEPHAEYVMLKDEHGGIHLIPAHLYAEIREETQQLKLSVDKRREYLRAVRESATQQFDADEPPEPGDRNLSRLIDEIREFSPMRRRVNRLFR